MIDCELNTYQKIKCGKFGWKGEIEMGKNGTAYIMLDEQETTINFSRIGNSATICTSDTTEKTKLNRLVERQPEHWSVVYDDGIFATYRCQPKSLISYRSKPVKRELSEEDRQVLADRLALARNKRVEKLSDTKSIE